MPDIGEIIKYIREERGYSQGDVAEWSGVYRKTVGEIERTGRGTITNVEKILGVLGYELEVVPKDGREA